MIVTARALTSPEDDPARAAAIMKEIYLEIFSYQADAIEAAIAAIGQMPRSMNPRDLRSMLIHQAEEFDHEAGQSRRPTGLLKHKLTK